MRSRFHASRDLFERFPSDTERVGLPLKVFEQLRRKFRNVGGLFSSSSTHRPSRREETKRPTVNSWLSDHRLDRSRSEFRVRTVTGLFGFTKKHCEGFLNPSFQLQLGKYSVLESLSTCLSTTKINLGCTDEGIESFFADRYNTKLSNLWYPHTSVNSFIFYKLSSPYLLVRPRRNKDERKTFLLVICWVVGSFRSRYHVRVLSVHPGPSGLLP